MKDEIAALAIIVVASAAWINWYLHDIREELRKLNGKNREDEEKDEP